MADANAILTAIAAWVSQTPAFDVVAGVAWVIPAVQTVHILAVAIVVGSSAMIHLQVLGAIEQRRPLSEAFSRYLPPIGCAVLVLAVSGLILITGEPTRAPFRVVFWVKLALVLLGVALTWTLAGLARRHGVANAAAATWDLKLVAIATLVVWAGVIVAGRWIGYVNAWPGAPA
jgi:uncharacterized membrane protein SirB2